MPLCFATIKLDGTEQCQIIFPRLDRDFAMGVPSDESLYNLFLVKLEEAIKNVLDAGVIHVDLYPSNILWRVDGTDVTIRIVDWDADTLDGDSFTSEMQARLKSDVNEEYFCISDGAPAEPKCDYWFLFILKNLTDQERNTMNGRMPAKVNQVYKDRVTRKSNSDLNLKVTFVAWYHDHLRKKD